MCSGEGEVQQRKHLVDLRLCSRHAVQVGFLHVGQCSIASRLVLHEAQSYWIWVGGVLSGGVEYPSCVRGCMV